MKWPLLCVRNFCIQVAYSNAMQKAYPYILPSKSDISNRVLMQAHIKMEHNTCAAHISHIKMLGQQKIWLRLRNSQMNGSGYKYDVRFTSTKKWK